ncbi:MAG: ribosome maturation factor RimM, partial [Alphaproteobacteria bacterium]|nr:ribosome maturation factor RimM [Alphaproteobacteria bacterium]
CVGAFVGAHGVRGQARLRSFTENPEDVFSYSPLTNESGDKVFALKRIGVMKDCFMVSVAGVSDRDVAAALKGTRLYVDRDALPKTKDGEYYEADLVGLEAVDLNGETKGKVLGVHDYGAGSFLEIKPVVGASYMLPFNDRFVPKIDIAAGVVTVDVPEGWPGEAKEK